MNADYLNNRFQAEGISLLKPDNRDQKWLDNFRTKVYNKKESPIEIEDFKNLVQKYSGKNPILIACTELSLYAIKNNSTCIDMANVQIEEFLK